MQVCKYASKQVSKYESIQECKYASTQVIQVCKLGKYARMPVCKCMQVCKYANMQVYKYKSMHICKYAGTQIVEKVNNFLDPPPPPFGLFSQFGTFFVWIAPLIIFHIVSTL